MNVIMFDGDCNLCNKTVDFIARHSRKDTFCFIPLQSPDGKRLTQPMKLPSENHMTVVYLENGKYYTRSTAILRIMKKMGGIWPLGYAFIIIPPFIRNWLYMLVSATRYRIFGKAGSCETRHNSSPHQGGCR